ncbi:MAG: GGDEF domain-containing protein [Candidatus Aenigmarchaeota archaeon]|nr:GGDEF domain-containing protein [Candidatus Aenigmarchaeota archaeon]
MDIQQSIIGLAEHDPAVAAFLRQVVAERLLVNLRWWTKVRMPRYDTLTGVYSREELDGILFDETARASRYQRSLSVVMLDINGLKPFNDTYGHQAGDELLRTAAAIFVTGMRNSDSVIRYGGDEFVVIMPETGRRGAIAAANRLGTSIDSYPFDGAHRITLAAGTATYNPRRKQPATPHELLGRADTAMYAAKKLSHDRGSSVTCAYESLHCPAHAGNGAGSAAVPYLNLASRRNL